MNIDFSFRISNSLHILSSANAELSQLLNRNYRLIVVFLNELEVDPNVIDLVTLPISLTTGADCVKLRCLDSKLDMPVFDLSHELCSPEAHDVYSRLYSDIISNIQSHIDGDLSDREVYLRSIVGVVKTYANVCCLLHPLIHNTVVSGDAFKAIIDTINLSLKHIADRDQQQIVSSHISGVCHATISYHTSLTGILSTLVDSAEDNINQLRYLKD